MELYLKVAFWMHIVAFIIRVGRISTATYPRIEEHSLGSDVAMVFITIPFFIWVVYLRGLL
jgi:hypothetical protein